MEEFVEKFEHKLDALESPVDKRDWKAEAILNTEVYLPEVWDMRNKCMEVRDQGAQGSCCGQTAATIKEIQEANEDGFDGWMSPQYIYNLRINQEGEGMYPRDVMQIMQKVGIVPEDDYPYGKREKLDRNNAYLAPKAANYKIEGYASVDTIEGLKLALYKNGPCMFTVPVYHPEGNMWKPLRPDAQINGGHSMTCVGYNKKGFILRNSWGEKWNGNGYTIFPYEDWGMQGEVWTTIDENSSKPDPRYTKWYWKLWRYLKGYKTKYGITVYTVGVGNLVFITVGLITGYYETLIAPAATIVFVMVRSILDYIKYYKRTHQKD